jgi:GNAT superfamily N-acetyltransferase
MHIGYLADHPNVIPTLARWFHDEWSAYYGHRTAAGTAREFEVCANRDRLPIVLVAFDGPTPCGTAALKAASILTHVHLGPWLSGLYVAPDRRRRGIAGELVSAVVQEAERQEFRILYVAARDGGRLFERLGWTVLEPTRYHGEELTILRRIVEASAA